MKLSIAGFLPVFALLVPWTTGVLAQPARQGESAQGGEYMFHGTVYYLPDSTASLPDFTRLQPAGTVASQRLEVEPRWFDQGFPGVPNRTEWFAIDYRADFRVTREGLYRFDLLSDDGSRLYVDGELVVDNDGMHDPMSIEGSLMLAAGAHSMRVEYFQGPRNVIALVLRCALGDNPLEIFDPREPGTVKAEIPQEERPYAQERARTGK
jgi:hypothetical protein